jgi:hypothetical protein
MKTIPVFIVIFLVLLGMLSCNKDEYDGLDCSSMAATYNANIKPIISASCTSSGCHNAGSSNGDFTTYNGLKQKVDNGSIENRVLKEKNMPPSSPLSLDDRKKIKCWIENGALNN